MIYCSLADLNVQIDNHRNWLRHLCEEYMIPEPETVDIFVDVTPDEIAAERAAQPDQHFTDGYLETVCAYRSLCLQLPQFEAFLLHASVVAVNGRGVAFMGHSGLGKTTHTKLWLQLLGDDICVVNGDKPIIRFIDGVPYAYGTPWAGKENMTTKMRVPLTDLCFLERSPVNETVPLDRGECAEMIMKQVLHPESPQQMMRMLDLLDRLLKSCRLWTVRCNMELDAAETAYRAIMGER